MCPKNSVYGSWKAGEGGEMGREDGRGKEVESGDLASFLQQMDLAEF